MIIVLTGFFKIGNSFVNVFEGSNNNISYDFLETIGMMTAFTQIILAIFSVPMIFINKKENPEVISGYLYGRGAFCLALFASIFTVFF